MMGFVRIVAVLLKAFFCSRLRLVAENLALRQQLVVLQRRASGQGCANVIESSGRGCLGCGVAGVAGVSWGEMEMKCMSDLSGL